MTIDHRKALLGIKRFDQLIVYLRDELGWPISRDSFDDVDDLFYDFSPEELGIDPKTAAKIQEIKRLRPLSAKQPWGIFFVKFEPKKLPVVVLRKILSQVALKRRESANSPERAAWSADDLLFISNYGEGDERQISFAHFSQSSTLSDLPTLRVLGWNNLDTPLHLDAVAAELTQNLRWPENDQDLNQWRQSWSRAFKLGHNEVINTAKVLSERLAELASSIRDRIKTTLSIESENGSLTKLMKAFQASLVHDLDVDKFADMYAQTIAYGLLSARITDPTKKTVDDLTFHMKTSPFLKELLEAFLHVGGRKGKAGEAGIDFDELGVGDVVNLLDNANIEAVVRDFGDRNRQEDPVMHFFEGFLQAYDKKIRKDRGVFYTPLPLVTYMVRSVHEVLQNELNLADGLADISTWRDVLEKYPKIKLPSQLKEGMKSISLDEPFIQILDPATGTGTFLVEVIDVIFKTLSKKWSEQGYSQSKQTMLWNDYVPKHLLTRLHAFELMMAPYAIAHMKICLKLSETGYEFKANERARIFLTNALEKPKAQISIIGLDALAKEAKSVNEIKKTKCFTVVIGNPPYSIQSANLSDEQRGLVDRYRFVDGVKIRERGALQFEKNIQDDYIKFFALAEETLGVSPLAIMSYVSNGNYLDASTLRGLRASLFHHFDKLYFLDLHGDGTGKNLPHSESSDENVFDILQGVAIGLFVKSPGGNKVIKRFDLGGNRIAKFKFLNTYTFLDNKSEILDPITPNYEFSKKDLEFGALWDNWVDIPSIFNQYSAGIISARDHVVIDDNRPALAERITSIRDSQLSNLDILEKYGIPDKKGWDCNKAFKQLREIGDINHEIHKIDYRPFDSRWIFYNSSLVWGIAWPTMQHMLAPDNLSIALCKQLNKRTDPWVHAFISGGLGESSYVSNKSKEVTSFFPAFLIKESGGIFGHEKLPNINQNFFQNLHQTPKNFFKNSPDLLIPYIYAVLFSRSYRLTFRDFLAREFPRIPFSTNPSILEDLAKLGSTLINLHLLKQVELNESLAIYTGPIDPFVDKVSWDNGMVVINSASSKSGKITEEAIGFMNVPKEVWDFHIGAYRVCDKWLKDKKGTILSRGDIDRYQLIITAISKTNKLMDQIDDLISVNGGWADFL